eukprot:TRINITY_DN7188_c0_g1_i6.p1 TRINITY_DN7188_c0_g1~~TRINITY_DN7188_c0_g1_i6.p1  ORF type:complete len:314 (+),score=55.29 TRINITY_DN7188_c0_g1_i6:23-964(+)
MRQTTRYTHFISSAASEVYKRQVSTQSTWRRKKKIQIKTLIFKIQSFQMDNLVIFPEAKIYNLIDPIMITVQDGNIQLEQLGVVNDEQGPRQVLVNIQYISVDKQSKQSNLVKPFGQDFTIGRYSNETDTDFKLDLPQDISRKHIKIECDKQNKKYNLICLNENGMYLRVYKLPLKQKMEFQIGKEILIIQDIQIDQNSSAMLKIQHGTQSSENMNSYVFSTKSFTLYNEIDKNEIYIGKNKLNQIQITNPEGVEQIQSCISFVNNQLIYEDFAPQTNINGSFMKKMEIELFNQLELKISMTYMKITKVYKYQ